MCRTLETSPAPPRAVVIARLRRAQLSEDKIYEGRADAAGAVERDRLREVEARSAKERAQLIRGAEPRAIEEAPPGEVYRAGDMPPAR